MVISVDFFDGNNLNIGTLVWDGSKFYWADLESDFLKKIIDEPVVLSDYSIVLSKKDPEKFIRNLYKEYHGTHLRATRPIIHK